MGTPAEERPSRYSTAAFVIRLVTSIVVPVALIGSVLWWFVARDQLDQAVERRAVTAAALVADVVDYDELKTGRQREGLYFGVWKMGNKLLRWPKTFNRIWY